MIDWVAQSHCLGDWERNAVISILKTSTVIKRRNLNFSFSKESCRTCLGTRFFFIVFLYQRHLWCEFKHNKSSHNGFMSYSICIRSSHTSLLAPMWLPWPLKRYISHLPVIIEPFCGFGHGRQLRGAIETHPHCIQMSATGMGLPSLSTSQLMVLPYPTISSTPVIEIRVPSACLWSNRTTRCGQPIRTGGERFRLHYDHVLLTVLRWRLRFYL